MFDANTVIQLRAVLSEGCKWVHERDLMNVAHWEKPTLSYTLWTLELCGVIRKRWNDGREYQWIETKPIV